MAAYRTCIRCNALKPEADYYIKKGYRMTVCKACEKEASKTWREQNGKAHKPAPLKTGWPYEWPQKPEIMGNKYWRVSK